MNNKDVLEDKKDDSDIWETQAAFLGPNLWDKTLPYDPDLKVQEVSNHNIIAYCVLCASRLPPSPDPRTALGNRVAASSSPLPHGTSVSFRFRIYYYFDCVFDVPIVAGALYYCQMYQCLANSVKAID